MIPHLLIIKNFLSYGDVPQTIDFDRYHLICLSGKNGHGKSALLDAMTWALWGQARKIGNASRPDDGVMRLGASRMLVVFEFSFNGNRYRVRREYYRAQGKAQLQLDFELFDPSADRYIALTDKTIRTTQEKIEQLIGLDFETYVNSAFLRQGQSNEFSKKSPKERKQLLATILGLSKYDLFAQRAQDRVRQLQEERLALTLLHDVATNEVAAESTIREALQTTQDRLDHMGRELTAHEQQVAMVVKEGEQMRLHYQASKDADQQLEVVEGQHRELVDRLKTANRVWKQLHRQRLTDDGQSVRRQYDQLCARERELDAASAQFQQINMKLAELVEACDRRHSWWEQQKIVFNQRHELERNKLSLAIEAQAGKVEHQEKTIAEVALQQNRLEQELKQVTQQKELCEKNLAGAEAQKTQFEKRRTFYQVMVHRGNALNQQLSDVQERQQVLDEQQSPSCPLCEQLLTGTRKKFLIQQLQRQQQLHQHQRNRITHVLTNLKQVLVDQHAQVQHYADLQRTADTRAASIQQITTALHSVRQRQIVEEKKGQEYAMILQALHYDLQTRLITQQQEYEQLLQSIIDDASLKTLTQEQQNLEQQLHTLAYDAQVHQQIRVAREQLSMNGMGTQDVFIALAEQRYIIISLCRELRSLRQQRDLLLRLAAQVPILEHQRKLVEQRHAALEEQRAALMTEKDQLNGQLGSLQQEFRRIEKLKQEIATRALQMQRLSAIGDDYAQLAQAFSKNGIQALLIEQAIPEIEAEANQLLGRLTDNQAQIFIESLRDLKKGGVRETLDIQIADASGMRPYEMFSGGEAFRIDFALRIAISKLLARRAGTALQTLIIDEGFGSQDEEGLGRLMDVMHTVQDDFAKIIIVSHLTSMKDDFPVHFVVEKGALGSQIRVEQRG